MGVGKTTIGKELAREIGWQHADLDNLIESDQRISIRELFEKKGESGFRIIERETLKRLGEENMVVSVGGGAPCDDQGRLWMLSRGLCVWLHADLAFIARRLKQGPNSRPLLSGARSEEDILNKLEVIYNERKSLYREAHIVVSSNDWNVRNFVGELRSLFKDNSRLLTHNE